MCICAEPRIVIHRSHYIRSDAGSVHFHCKVAYLRMWHGHKPTSTEVSSLFYTRSGSPLRYLFQEPALTLEKLEAFLDANPDTAK